MSKETNVYEKSPAREICIHEKRDHTDHQGNSRCLRYYTACQKRPICMKKALQKTYIYMKRDTTPIIKEIRHACSTKYTVSKKEKSPIALRTVEK